MKKPNKTTKNQDLKHNLTKSKITYYEVCGATVWAI